MNLAGPGVRERQDKPGWRPVERQADGKVRPRALRLRGYLIACNNRRTVASVRVDPRTSISDNQVRYVWNFSPFFKPSGKFICRATRKEVPDECNAARKDDERECDRGVRRAGGRRRVRRPLPARSPAQARLQRKGIRGRVRHRRRLVLELLSGRPGRYVRAAVSGLQRGALAGLELQRALSLVGGASRLFPPRRQEARSQP